MAIKGKKKSQSRGSQARRKPAQAPRAIATARRRTPWWKTPGWASILGIALIISIGVVIWAISNAKSNADDLKKRQETVNTYTGQIRAVVTKYSGAAGALGGVNPAQPPKDLAKSAKEWSAQFSSAQQEMAGLVPPSDLTGPNTIFLQSFSLYQTAADTYALAATSDTKTRNELLSRAASITGSATTIFQSAIDVLDQLRDQLDLSPSGLRAPVVTPAQGPQATPPVNTTPGG
jgi:hypothetical protein